MTDYQTITFEQSGAVARITLNRPDAANGMNDTMTRELAYAAARCDTAETKVVVLTGAGRFFSAGGDLKSFASAPSRGRYLKGVADDLHRAISTLARIDAVVITAVNGVAAGAGFSLAITGDLVLAAESASFTMAYTRAGLSPDGSATYHLRARADQLAQQMAATAGGSNGAVKALLLDTFANGLEEQMELEGRLIARRAESPDGREGVDAFLAKRKPDFV